MWIRGVREESREGVGVGRIGVIVRTWVFYLLDLVI
jgi:hypothetical protein